MNQSALQFQYERIDLKVPYVDITRQSGTKCVKKIDFFLSRTNSGTHPARFASNLPSRHMGKVVLKTQKSSATARNETCGAAVKEVDFLGVLNYNNLVSRN